MAKRSLVKIEEQGFEGYRCSSCAWRHPYPFIAGELEPRDDLMAAFHLHRCRQNPLPKKKTREDVNQAAARIVREATEKG
jgi:hypothetical protein